MSRFAKESKDVASGLAPGAYDIAVFPHSMVTNAFAAAKVVRVTIPSP